MMRDRLGRYGFALLGLLVLAAPAPAGEEKISIGKLPAAVKRTVEKKFPEAKIRGAARETEGGKTTFEVELTVEGRSVDVALNADGKILEVEREIAADDLPRPVKEELEEKYPGARILKAEKITRGEDGPARYEVAIKAEVVLTAKGRIVRGEVEDDDEPSAGSGKKKEKEGDEDDDDKPSARKKEKKEHEHGDKPSAKAEKKKDHDDEDSDR